MRFAIVESGGKQYRAVEGRTIEVDRLPDDAGTTFDFARVLLMADGDDVLVGTPTVSDILVKVTVVDHIKGPKLDRFRYRPKKRIRVRGGHRQHYTRLLVDFIGHPGEERKVEKTEAVDAAQDKPAVVVMEEAPEVEAAPKEKKQKARSEAAEPSTKKTSAKSATTTTRKSTTTKSSSKKTDTKKK